MRNWISIGVAIFWIFGACKPENLTPTERIPDTEISSIKVVQENFHGEPLVIAGSKAFNLVVSFKRTLENGTILNFKAVQNKLPVLLEDESESQWDIFGYAISGPRKGQKLSSTHGYMGYWFSWGSFHPGVKIYDGLSAPANVPTSTPTHDWLVARDLVFSATGKDAIPSLELPVVENFIGRNYLDQPFFLGDEDLIIGVKIGSQIRAYPHAILNWHEVVNDTLGGKSFALIYCPLTGTATAWSRMLNGQETTFGVSGLLYNNNVIPYDRQTESYWSQMENLCVFGEKKGEKPVEIRLVETTWELWKQMYKSPQILSNQTGHGRNYTLYPYGDYITNHNSLSFPLAYDDDRLLRKERVHGLVINGKARVYPLSVFE